MAWLWPAAVASIQPLSWVLPYAAGIALKRKKKSFLVLLCLDYKIKFCLGLEDETDHTLKFLPNLRLNFFHVEE